MPNRWIIALILVFWGTTTTWFFQREIYRRLLANEPPPFVIDLSEQMSASSSNWEVLQKSPPGKDQDYEHIGDGFTKVLRRSDRTFELQNIFTFQRFKLLHLRVQRMTSSYVVTEDGALNEIAAHVTLQFPGAKTGAIDLAIDIEGKVEDGFMEPKLQFQKMPVDLGQKKVRVSQNGNVLNPMHLLNKLPGLSVGRHWRLPMLDPLGIDFNGLLGAEVGELVRGAKNEAMSELTAEVKAETLTWDVKVGEQTRRQEFACFKIEYRDADQRLVAATWVRRDDHLVLQQEAKHQGWDIILRRSLTK